MALARYEHQGAAPATTLANSMSAGDTSFQVASGTGYPTGAGGKLFVIAVDPGQPSEEKILCSARSGVTFTVSGGVAGRGYDNTSATSHTAPTAVVQHVMAAIEIDDANDHIYTTTRDDHTQLLRTDGTRAATGPLTAPAHAANLTGTSGRYVGRSSGAPSSGTWVAGDFTDDPTFQTFWLCTTGGSPGTWVALGTSKYHFSYFRTAGFSAGGTPFVFDTQSFDPQSIYNNSTGQFVIPIAGIWTITAQVQSTTDATHPSTRSLSIKTGGGTNQLSGQPHTAAAGGAVCCPTLAAEIFLAAATTYRLDCTGFATGETGTTGAQNTFLTLSYRGAV